MKKKVDPEDTCRFCSVKSNTIHPKQNNLSSQLIEFQYIDEFHFYFAKTINELVNKSKTPETILFKDMLKDDPLDTYLKQVYKWGSITSNIKDLVRKNTKSRKFEKYSPQIMNLTFAKIYEKRKSKKQQNSSKLENIDSNKSRNLKSNTKYDQGIVVLNKLYEQSIDVNSFETKAHDLYYPSFSSDYLNLKKRYEIEDQLATQLQRSSFKTRSKYFINDSCISNRNGSNMFNSKKNGSFSQNLKWDQSDSRIIQNISEIDCIPELINSDEFFYKKKSAKKLILRTEGSECSEDIEQTRDLNKSFLNLSKSISHLIQSSRKNTEQRQLNLDCLLSGELTTKIDEKCQTLPNKVYQKASKKLGMPEKFNLNFKKNVKKNIQTKINLKSKVKNFKNTGAKTQRSNGTVTGTINSNSQQTNNRKKDVNFQSPNFKNTKLASLNTLNTFTVSKGKKPKKNHEFITSDLLKKNIVKTIKTQRSEFSPNSYAVPIGMQKCSWSPKDTKFKYSILNTGRHDSPKFTRKIKNPIVSKQSGSPNNKGFNKKKTPSIFLNTDSQAKPIEYPLTSKKVPDVSLKRKNVQKFNRFSDESFKLRPTSNTEIKLQNNSLVSGSQKDLGIITMLGFSPKIQPSSVKKSSKNKVLFMDRRRKIQVPLTNREKSGKMMQDLDTLTNFKKKQTKGNSQNALLSFRNRKTKGDNEDHFNTSNPKYNNIIFNGFNNNNIIKKFNISQNNNNITNINTSKVESGTPNTNRHKFNENQATSQTGFEPENIKIFHEESNTIAPSNTNNQNLSIQNFLSIHNNFINPSTAFRKNTSQRTSRRRKSVIATNSKTNIERTNQININSSQVTKEVLSAANLKKPKKNIRKDEISNILRANDLIPKFSTMRDSTMKTNNSTLVKNINAGKSSSKEIIKTNLKKKLDLNFKIPLHRINTEILVSPIEHQSSAPKSDRKTTNTKIDRYFNTNYTINNYNSNNLNHNNLSSMGNSIRLDKCSEKSTSRNNTYAKLPQRKKVKAPNNMIGDFRVKKTSSVTNNEAINIEENQQRKAFKKPCLSKEGNEIYQSWKNLKKNNEELSVNATNLSSKAFSTKRSVSKENLRKNSSLKNSNSLKLKDSKLLGKNLKKLKHQDLKNQKQTIFNEIKTSKPKIFGSLRDS